MICLEGKATGDTITSVCSPTQATSVLYISHTPTPLPLQLLSMPEVMLLYHTMQQEDILIAVSCAYFSTYVQDRVQFLFKTKLYQALLEKAKGEKGLKKSPA